MRGFIYESTSTAELLKGDLSRHSAMMAHHLRVTFPAAYTLRITAQVSPPVPLEFPCLLTALGGK